MARRVFAWIPAFAGTTMSLSLGKFKAHGSFAILRANRSVRDFPRTVLGAGRIPGLRAQWACGEIGKNSRSRRECVPWNEDAWSARLPVESSGYVSRESRSSLLGGRDDRL